MPARQQEGAFTIFRDKIYHPNILVRAEAFDRFVRRRVEQAGPQVELIVFRDPWGGVPALEARFPGSAAIFEVNALPSWELRYSYPGFNGNAGLRHKIRDMELYCLAAAQKITTVSEVTREALTALHVPESKISVIPNAAPACFFDTSVDETLVVEPARGRWFGYTGGLHSWQGIPTAITAFRMIASDFPDWNMLIIHSGRKAPLKLVKKIIRKLKLEDRVKLQAPMAPADLAGVIKRLAFTVAPLRDTPRNTVQGCCPVKIIESMAAGTPVLASDLRVCREVIQDGANGLLVAADQPRQWALAIQHLFGNNEIIRALSVQAAQTAQTQFAWEPIHSRLDALFEMARDETGNAAGGNEYGSEV